MSLRNPETLLIVANLLIPIAILTFASGFFPYKAFVPGTATYKENGINRVPKAPFDKVVFMVVDALRRSEARCSPCAVQERLIQAVISSILLIQGLSIPRGTHWTLVIQADS